MSKRKGASRSSPGTYDRGKQVGGGHYKDMAIEPAEYIMRNGIPWAEGSAIKYLSRHGKKNGAEDVKKAIHFCKMVLEMFYGHGVTVEYHESRNLKKPARRQRRT